MKRGDHIKVSRGLYSHRGIYIGNDEVIHFAGEKMEKINAIVRRDSIEAFAKGDTIEVVIHEGDCNSPEETVRRAEALLGEQDYHLINNNCEHLARWCKTGKKECWQIIRVGLAATVTTLVRYAPRLLSANKTPPGWGWAILAGVVILAVCADKTRPDDTPKIGE